MSKTPIADSLMEKEAGIFEFVTRLRRVEKDRAELVELVNAYICDGGLSYCAFVDRATALLARLEAE